MKIYIGAETIISPLGNTAEENFASLSQNISGIKKFELPGPDSYRDEKGIYLSKLIDVTNDNLYDTLLNKNLDSVKTKISSDIFSSNKTLFILSTTKGDMKRDIVDTIGKSVQNLQKSFSLQNAPLVVSNACASGVIAINTAAKYIKAGLYDNVVVIGCDIISDFVLYGFQSLFAISDKPCAPFDKDRTGITLGEACAVIVLSNNKTIFKETTIQYVEGTSSNDANHISGPSRTGEGLYRTVKNTLELAGISKDDIDFISAHGTATMYNDDMEAMAFDRLQMNAIPVNSLKGYFGHTLGTAGVLETAICLQSMRNNTLIKSFGFNEDGTVKKVNVITKNKFAKINTVLKTSSGFGGCNASLLLKKT